MAGWAATAAEAAMAATVVDVEADRAAVWAVEVATAGRVAKVATDAPEEVKAVEEAPTPQESHARSAERLAVNHDVQRGGKGRC